MYVEMRLVLSSLSAKVWAGYKRYLVGLSVRNGGGAYGASSSSSSSSSSSEPFPGRCWCFAKPGTFPFFGVRQQRRSRSSGSVLGRRVLHHGWIRMIIASKIRGGHRHAIDDGCTFVWWKPHSELPIHGIYGVNVDSPSCRLVTS